MSLVSEQDKAFSNYITLARAKAKDSHRMKMIL